MTRLNALELVHRTVDQGSFIHWPHRPVAPFAVNGNPSTAYLEQLAGARATSGVDESVIAGEARLDGRRIALVFGEFDFLAGSLGVSAAERLVSAIERATGENLPLLGGPASGGVRMQEGTVAFMQMIKITAAVTAHKRAGLPYVVYLRHPTTGGTFASWGSLGHVTAAEPGALIGFLGPRVYRALSGTDFPPDVQTSENLAAHGLVDAVVPPDQLRDFAVDALAVLAAPREAPTAVPDVDHEPPKGEPTWEAIVRSRRPERPGMRDLLLRVATTVTYLHGTGAGEIDPAVMLALARFGDVPCVVVGHDRDGTNEPMGPAGLRIARRAIYLADELKLPLLTVIDTSGAALSREAEEGGLAGEIARCVADLVATSVPTICLLLGEGAGGGALALLPADRVLCAQNAWLAPLPPEGASAIRHHVVSRASEMAQTQGVGSADLLRHGIADRIVTELPDAADEPGEFLSRVGCVLDHELAMLLPCSPAERVARRLDRYRRIGLGSEPSQHHGPSAL